MLRNHLVTETGILFQNGTPLYVLDRLKRMETRCQLATSNVQRRRLVPCRSPTLGVGRKDIGRWAVDTPGVWPAALTTTSRTC